MYRGPWFTHHGASCVALADVTSARQVVKAALQDCMPPGNCRNKLGWNAKHFAKVKEALVGKHLQPLERVIAEVGGNKDTCPTCTGLLKHGVRPPPS